MSASLSPRRRSERVPPAGDRRDVCPCPSVSDGLPNDGLGDVGPLSLDAARILRSRRSMTGVTACESGLSVTVTALLLCSAAHVVYDTCTEWSNSGGAKRQFQFES
jgi:hypothetical protein